MDEPPVLRLPGQSKLNRYRHTASCRRISGFVPMEEARRQQIRRTVAMVALIILWIFGLAAL